MLSMHIEFKDLETYCSVYLRKSVQSLAAHKAETSVATHDKEYRLSRISLRKILNK